VLCAQCDLRAATVHLSRVEHDGTTESLSLCERCAHEAELHLAGAGAAMPDEGAECNVCGQTIHTTGGWEAVAKDKRRKHWCVPCSLTYWEFLNRPENAVPDEFQQLAAGDAPTGPTRRDLRRAALEHVRIEAGKMKRKRWPN
jgi:hypothetical protein